jgi:hypothetical protein
MEPSNGVYMRPIHRDSVMKLLYCTPFKAGALHSAFVRTPICCLALGAAWMLLFGSCPTQGAVPPPNDTCAGAEVVPGTGPFPYLTAVTPDVSGATTTGDPVTDLCGLSNDILSRSVWYRFSPAESALYKLSVSGDTGTTVNDTVLAVYHAPNGCAGPFTEINCNDDDGLNLDNATKSALTQFLDAGETYYVVVWVFGEFGLDEGLTAVQLGVSKPAVPANDLCSGALEIPGAGPFPYLTPVVETILATQTGDPPLPSCRLSPFNRRSTWYRFTPSATAPYSLSTCSGTRTTIFDTMMAAYTSGNGCGGPFTLFACSENACGTRAEINAVLTAGVTYDIVVWDTEDQPAVSETDVQLLVTVPPAAITLPATSVTSTGAVVNGIIRPNGLRTTFWFEWGTDTGYGTRSSTKLLLSNVVEANTNALVTPILPNITYHYRVVATNLNGMITGQDLTFLWSSNRPSILSPTLPASGGALQFQFQGSPGQIYRIDSSSNLVTWTELGQATDLGGGLFRFIDATKPPPPRRFYRLHAP